MSGCDGRMVIARRTPNHKIVGSSSAEATLADQNHPAWATGDDREWRLGSLSRKMSTWR